MKLKYGKLAIELVITAILSAVILGLVNYILGLITPAESWNYLYTFLIAIVSVVFFVFILKLHKGKEEFLEVIPVVIIAASMVQLIQHWVTIIPSVATEFSWTNLAILISAVYLSDMLVKKYAMKILK